MWVKNINGTKARRPPYPYSSKSWIEFWEIITKCKAKKGMLGGHVIKTKSKDRSWYIAAITSEQNALNIPFEYSGALAKIHPQKG